MTGTETKLIYGSSNLTHGGFTKNIEFDYIGMPSDKELSKVQEFFAYCKGRSTIVDDELIQHYKTQQHIFDELNQTQQSVKNQLVGFKKRNDPFAIGDYYLQDSYFSFDDYEAFFARNAKSTDRTIHQQRLIVQEKMLAVHQMIYPTIKKLGIAHHKRMENITSLIRPCQYNKDSVGWIGVRYGKLPNEIDALNFGKAEDDDAYGFQKHGCLQFSINSHGFDINLFLAVKNGAIDRMKLSDNQYKMLYERRPLIETAMQKLVGHGFEWRIENGSEPFLLDVQPIEDFCEWFKVHDEDGFESYLMKYYKPDDPVLKSKEKIATEVIRVLSLLQPLYDAMVWRPLK